VNTYEIRIMREYDKEPLVVTAKLVGDHAAIRRAQMLAGRSGPVEVWRGMTCVYSTICEGVN
jgi:hypothetical protein